MKIVLVNRFFYPDLAPTGLLAYDGEGPGYAAEETVRGVHVHRV